MPTQESSESSTVANPQMVIDSFDGPVTQNEIDSFKSHIQTLTPAPDNFTTLDSGEKNNHWAQGRSGEQVKAMGLMYEITGDVAILDQMIRFCDALLSQRNDLASAPVGQYVIWTGRIDPVWPNDVTKNLIGTAGEQGDAVGHLGNCARLILITPSIWKRSVGIGDPYGYSETYLARAKKYVSEADYSIDEHILKSLLNLANQNHQYFSKEGDTGQENPYKPGKPVPWNQQMMFNYAFQNLEACHTILEDDPDRAAHYHAIVQASIDWFFNSEVQYDKDGNTAYNWGYEPRSDEEEDKKKGEDSNHGSLDVAGFWRAYATGSYGITFEMMTPFANTFVDVMTFEDEKGKHYSGRVDGSSIENDKKKKSTDYIRSGYLFLAEFRPDAYKEMMEGARLREGKTTGSIDAFSRFAWVKNQRDTVASDLNG